MAFQRNPVHDKAEGALEPLIVGPMNPKLCEHACTHFTQTYQKVQRRNITDQNKIEISVNIIHLLTGLKNYTVARSR